MIAFAVEESFDLPAAMQLGALCGKVMVWWSRTVQF